VNAPALSEAEKQRLAAAPSYDREIILSQIKWDRQKYLDKLDDTINSTHVPIVQGYPPRFNAPHVDLLYGGAIGGYFEKQTKRNCTIHSLNNALGYKAVSAKDMNATAREMAREKAEAYGKDSKTKRDLFSNLLSGLMSEDGNYSVSVAQRWMKSNGIDSSLVSPKDVDYSQGNFILSTTRNGIPHAVAVVDGILLDSLDEEPYAINGRLPKEYKVNAIVEIGKIPDSKELFIDLTGLSVSR
jgi:hypothetical protein